MIKTALFVAAAALATVATTAPVLANDVSVTYQDLDLTSQAGQHTLAARLDKAARVACGMDVVVTGSRLRSNEAVACYKQAKGRNETAMATLVEDKRLGG